MRATLKTCKIVTPSHDIGSIDDKEFILLNIEVPLTSKHPAPEESIAHYNTLNMGFKQYV